MRVPVPCTAFGLTLAATISAAHAQTVYDAAETVVAPQPVVVAPAATAVVAPPTLRTVRTVTTTTTHTIRRPLARRRVTVTRHIYVTDRVVPATTTTTTTVATAPAPYVSGPLYDTVAPPPATVEPYDAEPLYDTAVRTPPPAIIPAANAVPFGGAVPAYRYVYQEDRILVIDPNTGIAVQAIPR
jgi:hypothetical protein